jgi:tetratricopeptide (TPR) repeat protein
LAAAADYESSQRSNAERDFAWVNLGLFAARRGRIEEAVAHCRRALLADAGSVRAAVNLADLLRELGRDAEGEVVLRTALSHAWEKPPLQHALGLLLVRDGRRAEAMTMLAEAARAPTASARHLYVFAIALAGEGKTEDAVVQLEAAQRRDPWNRDVLEALATFTATARGAALAIPWAQKLVELDPQDEALRAQLVELQSAK